jgi:hypothetical protein
LGFLTSLKNKFCKLKFYFTDGTALFRAFLKNEYAEENLDFVLKVQKYRELDSKKRVKMAWKLYRNYIAIGAPHELNLDILSRKVTDLSMITPHLSTFDTSQKRIYNLLENDAYQRFLKWHIYLQLVNPDPIDENNQNGGAAGGSDTEATTL